MFFICGVMANSYCQDFMLSQLLDDGIRERKLFPMIVLTHQASL